MDWDDVFDDRNPDRSLLDDTDGAFLDLTIGPGSADLADLDGPPESGEDADARRDAARALERMQAGLSAASETESNSD